MTDVTLPTGEDLLRTLQAAFPTHAYALYGIEVDQILSITDPQTMTVPEVNTLAWLDTAPAPTKEDLAQAWVALQQQQAAAPLNVKGFESGIYADADLRKALATANSITFTMLLRLLDAAEPDFTSIQGALAELRASMSPDFTKAQLKRLTDLATKNGIPLTFK